MCELIWLVWDLSNIGKALWILINCFILPSWCPPVLLVQLWHLAKQYFLWNHFWKLHSRHEILQHSDGGEIWRKQSVHQRLRPCYSLRTRLLRQKPYSVGGTKVMQHNMLSREFLQQRWLYSNSWNRPRLTCSLVVGTRLFNRSYLVLGFWKIIIALTLKEQMFFLKGLAGFRFESSTVEYKKHNLEIWK